MLAMPSRNKPSEKPAPSAMPGDGSEGTGGAESPDFEPMAEEGPDLTAVPIEALEAELAKRKAAESAPAGGEAPPVAG